MIELVSAKQLQAMIEGGDKPLIIDARRRYEFNAGHIPNAVIMRWEQWCESAPSSTSSTLHQPGWWGRLGDLEKNEYANRLQELGVSKKRPTIVYADGARTKGRDGRIAWMLLYLGLRSVFILNGGWQAWNAVGGKVTADAALQETVNSSNKFDAEFDHSRRITLPQIKAKANFFCVDTRTNEEHAGLLYDYQPRKGRIPGSANVAFNSLYSDNGDFIHEQEFRNLVMVATDLRRSEFSYCEVGVRAATFSLLYELYFGDKLPVYDGSFMEWSLDESLDVETG